MHCVMSNKFVIGMIASLLTILIVSCANKNDSTQNKTETVVFIAKETPKTDIVVEKPSEPTTSYAYKIVNIKESSMKLLDNPEIRKMTYTVEIQSELSKLALDEIANVIAYSEPCEYVFIEYYLSNQSPNGPNYGISKRTPTDKSSQINYIAPPKKESAAKTPYDGCKVIGKWNMMGATLIVYQKGNNYYMVNYYGGSKYGDPERYIKIKFKGCTAFRNVDDPADVYVINKNGELDGYYDGDLATTFPKAL